MKKEIVDWRWIVRQPEFKYPMMIFGIMLVVGILLLVLSSCVRAETTASYYTYESCKREGSSGVWTASGERFDEEDLTAAMWDVSFGTLVRVTNLRNLKSVVVRINDRGPSRKLVEKGRIIDLSKGAFKKISDLRKGVIKVKVEIISRGGKNDVSNR